MDYHKLSTKCIFKIKYMVTHANEHRVLHSKFTQVPTLPRNRPPAVHRALTSRTRPAGASPSDRAVLPPPRRHSPVPSHGAPQRGY